MHHFQPSRRGFLATAGALALGTPTLARADSPPAPLTLTVPWPAGGPADVVARMLQPDLRQIAQAPVVVENIGGAGGLIGVDRFIKRAPAERGLLLGSNSELILSPLTNRSSGVRPEDFRLVAMAAMGGLVLMCREGLPVTTLDDLAAHAAKLPRGTLKLGHLGSGSLLHVAWEELSERTGIQALQAPYKGAPDILRDLANGDLDLSLLPLAAVVVQFPKLRAIGLSIADGHAMYPAIPPLAASAAARGYHVTGWFGLFTMTDVPATQAARLERLAAGAAAAPGYLQLAREARNHVPAAQPAAELQAFYLGEVARYRVLVRRFGLEA